MAGLNPHCSGCVKIVNFLPRRARRKIFFTDYQIVFGNQLRSYDLRNIPKCNLGMSKNPATDG